MKPNDFKITALSRDCNLQKSRKRKYDVQHCIVLQRNECTGCWQTHIVYGCGVEGWGGVGSWVQEAQVLFSRTVADGFSVGWRLKNESCPTFIEFFFTCVFSCILPPALLQVTSQDGGVLLVGADIQFRIWNPVMSVLSVQDLNASTRMTAQNALTQSLAKKTAREIQTERVKLGEYLGVRWHCSYSLLDFNQLLLKHAPCVSAQVDINELTRHWGLEVDRVELTLGSLLKAPDEGLSGPLVMPPSVPGLEGLAGPMQQLAMHFLSHVAQPQQKQGKAADVP